MKKFSITLILLSFFSLSACAQPEKWYGTYEYEALLGENVAEEQMSIEYTLIIAKEKCQIISKGYQIDETILCLAEESHNELEVKFLSFEDGSTKNIYGVESYPQESTLLKLVKKEKKLITQWKGLAPDDSFTEGEYFNRKAP